ncbi:hypothetical protein HPB48_011370 [Haemaphysalis longicornis]|uniref:Cytochrome P450 n=1 Tax=Haemaphysalis longicornis TaxID=44386 RepID=A0A9J6G1I3_HAELO|nr:hypothetical protein HPB48_011370 [Haemaphysalis longicornis]
MMMNAQEASEASEELTTSAGQSALNPEAETSQLKVRNVKNLTEVEALSQCVLFFLAGQDTASTATTFATYLLATNPHVQDRLRAEVDECFHKHGSSPSYDEVAKLPYLDCVVNETLRIMPPAARLPDVTSICSDNRLERFPAEDYVLGHTGIKVPSDCAIVVPVYAMHMDPEFFPEPEVFNPDRQVTSPSPLFLGGRGG